MENLEDQADLVSVDYLDQRATKDPLVCLDSME